MNPEELKQQKSAVILDARALAKRCLDLEKEIGDWRKRCESLEGEIHRIADEQHSGQSLIEFAQGELNRIKQRIHANLRIVALHGENADRLNYFKAKTEDAWSSPQEIARIDRFLEAEVRHLYPSQPRSKLHPASSNPTLQDNSLPAYRFAETNTETLLNRRKTTWQEL